MEPLSVFGIVGTVVGALLSAVFAYFLKKRQQIHQERMQLLPAYESRIESLEKSHDKCHEDRLKDREELATLKQEVRELNQKETLSQQLKLMDSYAHQRNHDMLGSLSIIANRCAETNFILNKLTDGVLTVKTTTTEGAGKP